MLPGIPGQDSRDGIGVHVVFTGKGYVGIHQHVGTNTNIAYLILSQLGAVSFIATKCAKVMIGVAFERVSRVVGLGANVQVIGIDTVRGAALVEYELSLRDSSVCQFVRNAMGKIASGKATAPIISASHPLPARFIINAKDVCPKSFRDDMVRLHDVSLSIVVPCLRS